MFEVGRMCLKTAGREAGKYCVVVKKIDENFVMVTGPKSVTSVKRRRCNINHLEPLAEVIKIKAEAPDEDILHAYQTANVFTKLEIEKPKKAAAKKEEAKEEEPKKEEPKEKPKPKKKEEKHKHKKKEKPKVKKHKKKASKKKSKARKKK